MSDSRNNPQIWLNACHRLLRSLDVMERGLRESDDLHQSDAEATALMIAGFAFENAFKAWFLRRGGELYQPQKKLMILKDHAYRDWATVHSFHLDDLEAEVLERAAFFAVAWGRYPFHNQLDREKRYETWGWSDVEVMKGLCDRLNRSNQ